ncbi:MAG: helix-turn-helix domain-containing protein [Phenylobacterium sp.]|uniref:helix-turn-helix domain-containing protein n=1 Tax=Phenylobacterium sp. TaxID=1871053 RepID=UPI0025E242FA|nr:helix-turn-helix transcriptional regulator [Phenylobacterium sp.]MBI1200747.1 helix-turn-helix domain-containing protein [Phenylobacterium sp.]
MTPRCCRICRVASNLSVDQLAREIGHVSPQRIAQYEAGDLGDDPDFAWVIRALAMRAGFRTVDRGEGRGGVRRMGEGRGRDHPVLLASQSAIARGFLDLTRGALRDASGIDFAAIARFEADEGSDDAVAEALRAFYDAHGLRFVLGGKVAGTVYPDPAVADLL